MFFQLLSGIKVKLVDRMMQSIYVLFYMLRARMTVGNNHKGYMIKDICIHVKYYINPENISRLLLQHLLQLLKRHLSLIVKKFAPFTYWTK